MVKRVWAQTHHRLDQVIWWKGKEEIGSGLATQSLTHSPGGVDGRGRCDVFGKWRLCSSGYTRGGNGRGGGTPLTLKALCMGEMSVSVCVSVCLGLSCFSELLLFYYVAKCVLTR